MLIRRLSINNVGNNRNYEYTLWSTAELIMLISLTLAALLTSIWLCCCCKKSKSKSARRQSRYQQEDEGERVSQHQRHHLQSSRHQHQQYRSRNHHHQRQLGDQERAGAVTANGNLDKQERPMVKQTSEVQQSREKPTSKLAQEVISLPSTDLAVPKNRLYLKKFATRRSPTVEQPSPSTPFDMAESVIPPPKRRPRIAKSSAVPSPQLQDGAGAMEQAAPAPEQSQAFKIYTETAIRNVQKPPQPQQTQRDVERERNVIEGKDGVHVENVTVQKTNSKK